jgi:hypothetical protein
MCTSAGWQDSLVRPLLTPSTLLEGASATDNERAEQEKDSPSTSSENSDLPADDPLDDKSRRFQCEHCDKSYAHNKDLTVSRLPSGYPKPLSQDSDRIKAAQQDFGMRNNPAL